MSELQDLVSRSSQFMAAVRALETKRPDRLFDDPYAERLAGAEIIAQIEPILKGSDDRGRPFVAVRTRFFDDFLFSSASQINQIVILGAGMDTRAFRLPWPPETCIYELDRPEVLQKKESILQDTPAKCQRICVAADLGQLWSSKLIAAGFQPKKPTLWLLEGFLYYLKDTEVYSLLNQISELSAIDSRLGTDSINIKMLQEAGNDLSRRWRYGCDRPEELFAEYGWKAVVIEPGNEEAHFGRFTFQKPPREVPGVARSFLVRATKENV